MIEKHRAGQWFYLAAFGGELGEMQARLWLQKPHKAKARYRCRLLSVGEDVTASLLRSSDSGDGL